MILSVIIVNYNVKYFLEQCLHSVFQSLSGLGPGAGSEVIVIDNNSGDGSVDYLSERFPGVQFIRNEENRGFAAANNRALRLARGEYIVFLNPDTILSEETARICVDFLASTPGAGAAGVRMVDGEGRFLPESRRGFPSAWVAFCRLSGLSSLFPRSRRFAEYYLGYLSEHANHPAPVLSGACFWCRKDILEKVGGFDERFFMYAEDIDLSHRIEREGYKNYYIADTTIVHFKGESTRKDLRYTRIFYKAMSQFRRKYRARGWSGLGDIAIEAAIWGRAGLAGLSNTWALFRGGKKSSPTRRIALTGDPATMTRLKERLPGWSMTASIQEADELVLCQGPAFSFRRCIELLQAGINGDALNPGETGRISYKIHAADSDSLAGSHSQTELLVFEKGHQTVTKGEQKDDQ